MTEPFIRKFPRVHLEKSLSQTFADLEAHLIWPNHEISDVVDLSYKGLAARKPALHAVSTMDRIPLEVALGKQKFSVNGKVVWLTDEAVGFEIETLSAESHRALGQYMDPNLLGAGLRAVDRSFFAKGADFDYWYQGGSGTHVLIWLDSARQIDHLRVDLNGQIVEFKAGRVVAAPSPQERQALLVLSQIDKAQIPMEEFIRSLGR
jgi:hypothetical protein